MTKKESEFPRLFPRNMRAKKRCASTQGSSSSEIHAEACCKLCSGAGGGRERRGETGAMGTGGCDSTAMRRRCDGDASTKRNRRAAPFVQYYTHNIWARSGVHRGAFESNTLTAIPRAMRVKRAELRERSSASARAVLFLRLILVCFRMTRARCYAVTERRATVISRVARCARAAAAAVCGECVLARSTLRSVWEQLLPPSSWPPSSSPSKLQISPRLPHSPRESGVKRMYSRLFA